MIFLDGSGKTPFGQPLEKSTNHPPNLEKILPTPVARIAGRVYRESLGV